MSTTFENHQAGTRSTPKRLMASYPVLAFLVMAYGAGWSIMIAAVSVGLPMLLSSSLRAVFGLALPAFFVTAARDGEAGVRALLRRVLKWRVGIGWYLLAYEPAAQPQTEAADAQAQPEQVRQPTSPRLPGDRTPRSPARRASTEEGGVR